MIAITGAGAIGQLWANRLSKEYPEKSVAYSPGSESVCFLSTRYERANSVKIKTEYGDSWTIPLWNAASISPELLNQVNVLFLCTKSYSALSAARSLDKLLPSHIPLVLFQNGLGSQRAITIKISNRPVFAASTTSGSNITPDGTLRLAGHGTTQVGALNQMASESVLKKAFHPRLIEHFRYENQIETTLWRKLLINCGINAITALENCLNGDITNTLTFRSQWPDLMSELAHLHEYANLQPNEIEPLILDVARQTKANVSSMLQDIRRGRPTEIDAINGFAADTLESLGYHAPVNRELVRRVHALGH